MSRRESQQTAARRVGEIGLFLQELLLLSVDLKFNLSSSCGSLGASEDPAATRRWPGVEG